ncbi:hypothetical protein KFU94_60220 [Chloroflexi bacterium TSY]|nr:hypothetical protein [Chloroflexi bacterium TSY]
MSQPLDDPVTYGHALCAALFPADLPVQQALAAESEQILLVIEDPTLHIGQSRTLSPSVGEAPVARRNAGLISVNPHKRVERQCASAYSDC